MNQMILAMNYFKNILIFVAPTVLTKKLFETKDKNKIIT